jgi:FSR family fosmidomycin resistance protein-like MFS transporter
MPTQNEVSGLTGKQEIAENTVFAVLIAISVSHLLNDTIQSVIPAIYPILKDSFHLSFTQIGLITLAFQLTASLLQPFVGLYTDHRPKPYSLAIGMGFTLVGLLLLSIARNFPMILCAAALVGMGSSVFHPEASRLARMASGGRHGFAQSIFQVGGNAGTSLGPLLAALIIVPRGQRSVGWFSLLALLAIIVLSNVGHWYKKNLFRLKKGTRAKVPEGHPVLSRRRIVLALAVLMSLMFSKFFYLASMTNYFTF